MTLIYFQSLIKPDFIFLNIAHIQSVSVSSYWVIQTSVWHDRKKLLMILKRKIVWCCFWNLVSTNSQNYLERFPESKAFRNFRLYEIMFKILGNHLNSFRAMYPLARKKEYVHTVVSSARDTEGLYYPWHIFSRNAWTATLEFSNSVETIK